jgi:hypothetical protein
MRLPINLTTSPATESRNAPKAFRFPPKAAVLRRFGETCQRRRWLSRACPTRMRSWRGMWASLHDHLPCHYATTQRGPRFEFWRAWSCLNEPGSIGDETAFFPVPNESGTVVHAYVIATAMLHLIHRHIGAGKNLDVAVVG